MDTTAIHDELATTLGVTLQPGAHLPPRIELRNDKTQVKLSVRYFPEQARVAIVIDSIAGPRKSFIGSMNARGVESVDLDREGKRVMFGLESGEVLTVYADARFTRGVSAP